MPQLGISSSLVYPSFAQEAVEANTYYIPLDGVDDHVAGSVTSPSFADTSFTISMWVKFTFGSSKPLFSIGGAKSSPLIYLDSNTSNELFFVVNDGATNVVSQTSTAAIPSELSNTWMNVVVIFDKGADITFMANGVRVGDVITETDNTSISITGNFFLGRRGSNYLLGDLDTTIIWRSALGETEILEAYTAGQLFDPRTDAGNYASSADLVAWYKMGDGTEAGSGSTVYDMSDDSREPNNLTIWGLTGFTEL